MTFQVGDILRGNYDGNEYEIVRVDGEFYVIRMISSGEEWDDYTLRELQEHWTLVKRSGPKPLSKFAQFQRRIAA